MRRFATILVCLAVLPPLPADALTLLTAGKQATFYDRPGTGSDSARIEVRGEGALRGAPNPRSCAQAAALEIASYPVAQNLVVKNLVVPLPCAGWHPSGTGHRFRDAAAGVEVRLASDALAIRVSGGAYTAVAGPVGYVEAWLTLGDERYLIRFHDFARNDERAILARRPAAAAAAGEAAFWATLWGDAEREEETIDLLERAVSLNRRDGRSRFLLGMMHLYRFGNATPDLHRASAFARAEIDAATRAFRVATPLLWDGTRGDSRVPGFAAAATYVRGVATGDQGAIARGLDELEVAYDANPLFNSFDLIGVVPPVVAPTDPLYERAVEVLDAALSGQIGSCAGGQDEICGNRGMAPHNGEGAFLLFGDIYAKAGRASDAQVWYDAAAGLGASSGWDARFVAIARSRAASVAERVALYQDGDPANDPSFIGSGPGACSYCHVK